jgi:hypothetical protein
MTVPVNYGDVDWLRESLSTFHREHQHVEGEYLELRILLRNAEAALRAEPEDRNMDVRAYYLKRRLEDLQQRHPWIASGRSPEIAFWSHCPDKVSSCCPDPAWNGTQFGEGKMPFCAKPGHRYQVQESA